MDNWNTNNNFGQDPAPQENTWGQSQENTWGQSQENNWENTEDNTGDDALDALFGDDLGTEEDTPVESTEEDTPVESTEEDTPVETHEDTPVVTETTEETDTEDEEEPGEEFVDSIDGKFIKAPTSAKTTAAFSERQVYKIINLVTVFKASNEDETNLVGTLFGVRGTSIRKAMTLAETNAPEMTEKLTTVTTLEQIRKAATGEGVGDPMDFAIALFARIEGLNDDQKATMISLVKSYQDETGAKRVRINRGSATAEIIKEIKDAMSGENSIAELVQETGVIVESIEKAVQ